MTATIKPKKIHKVCIMEFMCHHTYLATTIRLLENSSEIALILSSNVQEKLQNDYNLSLDSYDTLIIDRIDWRIINNFLAEKRITHLFINTIADLELAYCLAVYGSRLPYFVTVHNFDAWLGKRPFFENHPDRQKENELFIECCRKITEECRTLITIDENILELMKNDIKKPIFMIPNQINESYISPSELKISGKLTFTVTGSVEETRRDYWQLLSAFEHLAYHYRDRIQLILLGRPMGAYGKAIIGAAAELNKRYQIELIKYSTQYVNEMLFQRTLNHTDYFIAPLTEIYGKYKASGGFMDSVRSGAPILVPKTLQFSSAFLQKYGNGLILYENLYETIETVIHLDTHQRKLLRNSAVRNANYYYIENHTRRISQLLSASSN